MNKIIGVVLFLLFSQAVSAAPYVKGDNFLWQVDGVGNIGADGATRPDKAFVKSELRVGGVVFTPGEIRWPVGSQAIFAAGQTAEAQIWGGESDNLGGDGGGAFLLSGNASGTGNGGEAGSYGGNSASGSGGSATLNGGSSASGTGGNVELVGGSGASGGSIFIRTNAGATDLVVVNPSGSVSLMSPSGANLIWNTDGGGNIGGLAANRPDRIRVKTELRVGGVKFDVNEIRWPAGQSARLYAGDSVASGIAAEEMQVWGGTGLGVGNGGGSILIAGDSDAGTGGEGSVFGGNSYSGAGGFSSLNAGDSTLGVGGDAMVGAGTGGGGNGKVMLQTGDITRLSVTGSVVAIGGTGDTTTVHEWNGATVAPGASTSTFTNAPAGAAGNPDVWMKVKYNGVEYVTPLWTAN